MRWFGGDPPSPHQRHVAPNRVATQRRTRHSASLWRYMLLWSLYAVLVLVFLVWAQSRLNTKQANPRSSPWAALDSNSRTAAVPPAAPAAVASPNIAATQPVDPPRLPKPPPKPKKKKKVVEKNCTLTFSSKPSGTSCVGNSAQGVWCRFENLRLNTTHITMNRGGEALDTVMGQGEGVEMPSYTRGAFTTSEPEPDLPKKAALDYLRPVFEDALAYNYDAATMGAIPCVATVYTPTLFITRAEYANLYHTLLDLVNVFEVMTKQELAGANIVWLDAHPHNELLDETWSVLFGGPVRYVNQIQSGTCFAEAHFVPSGHISMLMRQPTPEACIHGPRPIIDAFVEHTLQRYGLSSVEADPRRLLLIDRRPYVSHPRVVGNKASRMIADVPALSASLSSMFGWDVKVIQLHKLSFREQLLEVRQASLLLGMHGAGLSHLMFLHRHAEAVEINHNSHLKMFSAMAKWRPGITYRQLRVPEAKPPDGLYYLNSTAVAQEVGAPLGGRLALIVPFRDDAGDNESLAQGQGRWANLAEFVPAICSFLTDANRSFDVFVIEQTQGGAFNKGALFNAGVNLYPNYEYYAFHDVDQVPMMKENSYHMPRLPLHLWAGNEDEEPMDFDIVGGALLMSRTDFIAVNGYSNRYYGWGLEDQDMAFRIKNTLGKFERNSPSVGRYHRLEHARVNGLDTTATYWRNFDMLQRSRDRKSDPGGLDSLRFRSVSKNSLETPCTGSMRQPSRTIVEILGDNHDLLVGEAKEALIQWLVQLKSMEEKTATGKVTEAVRELWSGDEPTLSEKERKERLVILPHACNTCSAGGKDDGGVELSNGRCLAWCSSGGFCGTSDDYRRKGENCKLYFSLRPLPADSLPPVGNLSTQTKGAMLLPSTSIK